MSRYKDYPGYKDSGVEWVGSIPNSWDVSPLFSLASTDVLKNDDGAENNVLSLSYGRIIRRDVEDNHGLLPESFNTYQLVAAGDIILRLTDLQNDKRSLRVGLACEKGIITSAYLKLTAKQKFLDRYLYRLLHSYDTTKVFYGMGGGLRQSMKFEEMRRLQMLCPSLEEQKQIADFLDHETAKIDALIEKQQRLIELLKEKRQAVISHAVTKGLNPNAPMKDSGVEWLGNIPFDWECVRLKFASQLSGGKVAPSNEERYVGLENVQSNSGKFIATEEVIPEGISNVFSRGDVLFGKLRPYLAKSWLADFSGICSSEFLVMTSRKVDSKFLHYFTLTEEFIKQVDSSTYGSKMPRASWDYIGLLNIPIPSHESEKIASFLDHETAKIDALIEKQLRLIELAKERRTALISAAVTGKIDVRDWQAAA